MWSLHSWPTTHMSWMCYKSFNFPNSGQWNHCSSLAQVLGTHLWYCRYVTEGSMCISRKTRYVSNLWCHVWCNTLSSTQHQSVYNQVWKVLSSILDRITERIFEKMLLYNFLWSFADVFSGDYLRMCMLISVASSLVYKTTRSNG